MANPTMTLISSQVLGSSVASVTFSSIPQTYTDLKLVSSSRTDGGVSADTIKMQFNSDTTTNYSWTYLIEDSSGSAGSGRTSSNPYFSQIIIDGSASTSNVFGSADIYISNYTLSSTKQLISFSTQENNSATAASIWLNAQYYRGTSPITSITLIANGDNFIANSSFYLYGIKNS